MCFLSIISKAELSSTQCIVVHKRGLTGHVPTTEALCSHSYILDHSSQFSLLLVHSSIITHHSSAQITPNTCHQRRLTPHQLLCIRHKHVQHVVNTPPTLSTSCHPLGHGTCFTAINQRGVAYFQRWPCRKQHCAPPGCNWLCYKIRRLLLFWDRDRAILGVDGCALLPA